MEMRRIPATLFALLLTLTGCATLNDAALDGDLSEVQALLAEGEPVDRRDEAGSTPLMAAAKADRTRVIRLLLASGADPDATDRFGKSALWYAYDYGHPEAFRMLLDSGASADFLLEDAGPPGTPEKRRMYDLAREHALVRSIRKLGGGAAIGRFETYFTRYRDGAFAPRVLEMLREIVRADYEDIQPHGENGDPEALRRFLSTYSRLGNPLYEVTATRLNIRSGPAVTTRRVGEYLNGEVVAVLETSDGWLRTDRGWISGAYARRLRDGITVVTPYIRKVREHLADLARNAAVKGKNLDIKAPAEPGASRRKAVSTPAPERTPASPEARARRELESILAAPTLEKLETFIRTYRDQDGLDAVVGEARRRYRMILLGQ